MDTLDVLFTIGLILWFFSLAITWTWVLIRLNPPDQGYAKENKFKFRSWQWWEPWWKIRQKALLLTWGPPIVLVALYWALKQLL